MARVTALCLRARAREAMLSAGGRGFVRFLSAGGALLATDAIRRCADEAARDALTDTLAQAGFVCEVRGGLLELTPADDVLSALSASGRTAIDWESPLHPAQALAARFLATEKQPLTREGRQLIVETLRLTWQTPETLFSGLPALRAQAAVMQRRGDRSGMHQAGALLREFCEQEAKG